MINVFLADDHAILRDGIKVLLNAEKNMRVVGEAENGDEAIQKCRELKPDIVLMDISMPIINGLEAARQILRFVSTRIILLSMHADEEYIIRALQVGVSGYIEKQSAATTLIQAVNDVFAGKKYFSPTVSSVLIDAALDHRAESGVSRLDTLTFREKQILQLLAEGKKAPEISKMLYIAEATIYKHRFNLMKKLGLYNLADLTRFAVENKLVSG